MTVAQSDGEAASFEAGFEIEYPEHPHAVFGYRVFLRDYPNMAETHALDERFNHTMVCDRLVGFGCGRCWHVRQFRSSYLTVARDQRARL
jgi:hypothetical protein